MIVLDMEAIIQYQKFLKAVELMKQRLVSIPEQPSEAAATSRVLEAAGRLSTAMGKHWMRCSQQYQWITEEFDESKPMAPNVAQ